MDLIKKAIDKYSHIPDKVHGSLSYCKSSNSENILDLSSSCLEINLKKIAASFINNKDLSQYPDPDARKFKKAVAKRLKISNENILVTNGSSEAILFICLAFCAKNSKILLPGITYSEYERTAKLFTTNIKKIVLKESENYFLSLNAIEKSLKTKPDIVFLCNPNNPTGQYMDETILEICKKYSEILFVIDEAYLGFVKNPWRSEKAINLGNIIIMRSFTKTNGLAGIRLGHIISSAKIIQLLDSIKTPWNVNYLAAKMGTYLIANPIIIQKEIDNYLKGKYLLFKSLKENYFTIPSRTNYFLLKVKDSKMIQQKLLENNILVRECASFGLDDYIRINARKPKDCKLFLKTFKKVTGGING